MNDNHERYLLLDPYDFLREVQRPYDGKPHHETLPAGTVIARNNKSGIWYLPTDPTLSRMFIRGRWRKLGPLEILALEAG